MNIVGKVTVKMKPVQQILKAKGMTPDGDVQRFHTENVLHRIVKYLPYRTGATIGITQAQTNVNEPFIITDVPYAKYLYYGKVMVGRAPKVPIDKDLEYTPTKNPHAGPFWDRALVASEGNALQADLQAYVNRKAGRR